MKEKKKKAVSDFKNIKHKETVCNGVNACARTRVRDRIFRKIRDTI